PHPGRQCHRVPPWWTSPSPQRRRANEHKESSLHASPEAPRSHEKRAKPGFLSLTTTGLTAETAEVRRDAQRPLCGPLRFLRVLCGSRFFFMGADWSVTPESVSRRSLFRAGKGKKQETEKGWERGRGSFSARCGESLRVRV